MSHYNQRPIDESVKKSYYWLTKTYVFISKTKVKTWQSVFVIAFITGIAVALIWSVSADWHVFSSAANPAPDNKCIAMPPGGEFSEATKVQIMCGKYVVEASYTWGEQETVITGRKVKTNFEANINQTLTIQGRSEYDGGHDKKLNRYKKNLERYEQKYIDLEERLSYLINKGVRESIIQRYINRLVKIESKIGELEQKIVDLEKIIDSINSSFENKYEFKTKSIERGFYNVKKINDTIGDATPGSEVIVDFKNFEIRQIGDYVQFVLQVNGDLTNREKQYYFLLIDTDLNLNTGRNFENKLGAEMQIDFFTNIQELIYYDENGNIINKENGNIVITEGDKLYFNVKKGNLNTNEFNIYFFTHGPSQKSDTSDTVINYKLEDIKETIEYAIDSENAVIKNNPTLISIRSTSTPVQINSYKILNGSKQKVENINYSISHPVPHNAVIPTSMVSVDSNGVARYLKEGFVYVVAYDDYYLPSNKTIIATGDVYGDLLNDNVITVFPSEYKPEYSNVTMGYMMNNTGFQTRVNQIYDIESSLYNGFKPHNGDKQVIALFEELGQGGCFNGNPLASPSGCYMGGDGTPQYVLITHEMGHDFSYAKGLQQLIYANNNRINQLGAAECVASLPVITTSLEFYNYPEKYGLEINSQEWNYFKNHLNNDTRQVERTLGNLEQAINNEEIEGVFDLNSLSQEDIENRRLDPVSVLCSLFQYFSYDLAVEENIHSYGMVERFLNLFGDSELENFQEDKVETYFAAAYSHAVGLDMREKLRFWGFTIEDSYYKDILKNTFNSEIKIDDPINPVSDTGKTFNLALKVDSFDEKDSLIEKSDFFVWGNVEFSTISDQDAESILNLNPDTNIAIYKSLSEIKNLDPDLNNMNDDWFMKCEDGSKVIFTKYNNFLANIGNPEFRQYWIDRVKQAFSKQENYNSLFIDIAGLTKVYDNMPCKLLDIDNQDELNYFWKTNTEQFLREIKEEFNDYTVVSNSIQITYYTRFGEEYGGFDLVDIIDGVVSESWISSFNATEDQWKTLMRLYLEVLQKEKYISMQVKMSSSDKQALYGYASQLLINSPKLLVNAVISDRDIYNINLGVPVDVTKNSVDEYFNNTIYLREYTNGLVLVNPSNEVRTYSLDKEMNLVLLNNGEVTYENTQEVTLNPQSGAILISEID